MIDPWPHDFIPGDIINNITLLSSNDTHEREGYAVGLEAGNNENDFAAAQETATGSSTDDYDLNEPFLTGSVMSNVNGERSHSDFRTLDALLHIVNW